MGERWGNALARRVALPVVLLIAVPAHAEPSEADALFSQGRDLMEKGRFLEACEKLRRSEELAPAVGTLLNLGFCYEQTAKLRSAMEAYSEAEILARQANDNKRAAFAKERIAAVEPKVLKLVVRVVTPDLAGLAILRGGKPVPRTDWNHPIAVDNEEHVVEATAPGYVPWKGVVSVRGDGAVVSMFVPPLVPENAKTAEGGAEKGGVTIGPRRIIAVGLGVLGVASFSAGVGVGLAAKGQYDDARAHCDPTGCDERGLAEQRSAVSEGNLGTALGILGLVSLGAGVALWLLDGGSAKAKVGGASATRFVF